MTRPQRLCNTFRALQCRCNGTCPLPRPFQLHLLRHHVRTRISTLTSSHKSATHASRVPPAGPHLLQATARHASGRGHGAAGQGPAVWRASQPLGPTRLPGIQAALVRCYRLLARLPLLCRMGGRAHGRVAGLPHEAMFCVELPGAVQGSSPAAHRGFGRTLEAQATACSAKAAVARTLSTCMCWVARHAQGVRRSSAQPCVA